MASFLDRFKQGLSRTRDILNADVFCRPCMLRDCPIDHRCMKRITVDTVVDAVARRLRADGSR